MKHDVAIIGAGPAGLSAAIYAGRAGLKVSLLEKLVPGGQAATTSFIENYPGFSEPISGPELMERMKAQAEKLEVEFIDDEITNILSEVASLPWGLKLNGLEGDYEAKAVIIATGATSKKLGIPGEEKFIGRGVSYCATCDGPLFKGKEIVVVGGGDRAIEEGLYLSLFAKSVTVVHRRDKLRAQEVLARRARANEKMNFLLDTVVTEIDGNRSVEEIKVKNLKEGREKDFSCQGVFIFVGLLPNTGFIKNLILLDEGGYIITNEEMATSREGIFAAGDVRKKTLRQIVTACGDGAIAAMSAFRYIKG